MHQETEKQTNNILDENTGKEDLLELVKKISDLEKRVERLEKIVDEIYVFLKTLVL